MNKKAMEMLVCDFEPESSLTLTLVSDLEDFCYVRFPFLYSG